MNDIRLPSHIRTVNLTFGPYWTIDGAQDKRSVTIKGPCAILDTISGGVIFRGAQFWGKHELSVQLPATDGESLSPRGFTYTVEVGDVLKNVYLPSNSPDFVDFDMLLPTEWSGGTVWYPSDWAVDQATRAEAAAEAAEISKTIAAQHAADSADNADSALSSKNSAFDSQTAAGQSKEDARTARDGAVAAQAGAEDARDAAALSASAAAGSAMSASGSSSAAALSASDAEGSASAAAGSALSAAGSAADAQSARDAAVTARTDAQTARTDAQTALSGAQLARTGAESAQTTAAGSATAAAGSATNAAASATLAATNAANAVPKSTVTTKGDLILGTGASTVSRVAVGLPGTTLVPDASSPTGVKWSFPPMLKWGPGDPRTPATTAVGGVNVIDGTEVNGSEYTSTDGGGLGAWKWQKRAGVWWVTVGDTGCLIKSQWDSAGAMSVGVMPTGWTHSGGTGGGWIFVRRRGSRVTVGVGGIKSLGAGYPLFVLPTSYRPTEDFSTLVAVDTAIYTAIKARRFTVGTNGTVLPDIEADRIIGQSNVPTAAIVHFDTAANWPTTLTI